MDNGNASSAEATPPANSPSVSNSRRPVLLGSIVVLGGFVGIFSPKLWSEYRALKQNWNDEVSSRVVRYKGVFLKPSYADAPANWFHDEGDSSKLWAGWNRKANQHNWFDVGKGDLNPKLLSASAGKDISESIRCPIFETKNGDYWDRVPFGHRVYLWESSNGTFAYPEAILEKVIVVNDPNQTPPTAVVFKPLSHPDQAADVYASSGKTKPFLLGQTGYLLGQTPLLYDRGEGNLWKIEEDGLHALSGPSKGTILPRLGQLKSLSWGDVKSNFSKASLLVGADREQEMSLR